jgi:hypothetical protein
VDRARISEVARAHKALLQLPAAERHSPAREARVFETLWVSIREEADEYCTAYNDAFGAARIKLESHPDSIVIRSRLDPQDTLVFHRTPSTDTHRGTLEVHRYHYGQQPITLPTGVVSSDTGDVTLMYDGRSTTPQDLVFEALSIFTEELARSERRDLGNREGT